jgi:hypothetical protein
MSGKVFFHAPHCGDGRAVTASNDDEIFEGLIVKSHLALVIKHRTHHTRCLDLAFPVVEERVCPEVDRGGVKVVPAERQGVQKYGDVE